VGSSGTDDARVALLEPARVQVVMIAADVLGKLPADEVPSPLRRFARFAPAKRRQLGSIALAAALDADDDFRSKVAEVITETSPELTAAVREGGSTAAADPIDVAVVAYLTRPDGWEDVLAAANKRWADEHGAASGQREELDKLRGELAELRGQLKGEPARIRVAVASAAADVTHELTELRKSVRERTRELRQAERERDAAGAVAHELRGRLDAQSATHDAELRRQRARQAEVERSAETARRGSRTERDVDDARLWLLIDTLVQAASGLRRELSLPPPALYPADTVDAAEAAAGPHSADDVVALDRLLAMPNVHVIIDGYNVTKTGYGDLSLAEQRTRLISAVAALVAQRGVETTVVFDGGERPPAQPAVPRGVRVLFSAPDEIADDLIRRLVASEPPGRPLLVVTSDRQVVSDSSRYGAWSTPSRVLLDRLG
jgi:predicted RNA-binding protein with PIN domain